MSIKSPFSNIYSSRPRLSFGVNIEEIPDGAPVSPDTPVFGPRATPKPFRPMPLALSAPTRSTRSSRSVSGSKKTSSSRTKCSRGKERNPVSGRCVKKCTKTQLRNPATGRCVRTKKVCTKVPTQRTRKVKQCTKVPVTRQVKRCRKVPVTKTVMTKKCKREMSLPTPRTPSAESVALKDTFNRLLSTYGETITLKKGVTEKRLPSWVRFPHRIRGIPKKLSKPDAMKRVGSLLSACKRNGVSLLDKKGKYFKTYGTLRRECKFRIAPKVMAAVDKKMGLTLRQFVLATVPYRS